MRSYSNYLSPVWGFSTDFFTLVAIFLRNLLLNACEATRSGGTISFAAHVSNDAVEFTMSGGAPGLNTESVPPIHVYELCGGK